MWIRAEIAAGEISPAAILRALPERGSFCPACLKKSQVLARVWKYLRPHWAKATLAASCMLFATGLQLIPPLLVWTLLLGLTLAPAVVRERASQTWIMLRVTPYSVESLLLARLGGSEPQLKPITRRQSDSAT